MTKSIEDEVVEGRIVYCLLPIDHCLKAIGTNDPDGNVNIANLETSKQLMTSLAAQLKQGWKAAVPH